MNPDLIDGRAGLLAVVSNSHKAKKNLERKNHRLSGILAMLESNRDAALHEALVQRENILKRIDESFQDRQANINHFFDEYYDRLSILKNENDRQISEFNVCFADSTDILGISNEERCMTSECYQLASKMDTLCQNISNADVINVEKPLCAVYVPTTNKENFKPASLGYLKTSELDVKTCKIVFNKSCTPPRLYIDLGNRCPDWRDYLDVKLQMRDNICVVELESKDNGRTVDIMFGLDSGEFTARATLYNSPISNSPFHFTVSPDLSLVKNSTILGVFNSLPQKFL